MNVTMNATEVRGLNSQGNVSGNGSDWGHILDFNSVTNKVINILTIIIICITMASLGCQMEISKIKCHFLKPKGVAIAMVAQFGIMPLTAFGLARLLQMPDIETLTMLICGCCPGGTMSNVFALAIGGDMNLSIVLTTCSSFAAMGMMPLLLFIFSQGFQGLKNSVPYASIIIGLVLTTVPCAVGIALKHYMPKYSKLIMKVGLSILVISGILAIVLSGLVLKDILWIIFTARNLTAAALMPLIGYLLGYVFGVVFRLNTQCARTISMETGCQNIQLCFAILKLAFPPEVTGPLFLFPLLYLIFQITEALLLTLCYRCYKKFKPPAEDTHKYTSVDVKPEEVKQP